MNKIPIQSIRWGKHRLKEAAPRKRQLLHSEEARIIPNLRQGYGAAFCFGLIMGLRLGNLTSLRWSEVCFERGCLDLIRTKGGDPLTVPLSAHAIELLNDQEGNHPEFVFTFVSERTWKNPKNGRAYVKGRRYPLTYWGFRTWLLRFTKAQRLENFKPHDLRRTAGSRITASKGLEYAQELLGHADITLTKRHYGHIGQDRLREAMEATAEDSASRIGDIEAQAAAGCKLLQTGPRISRRRPSSRSR